MNNEEYRIDSTHKSGNFVQTASGLTLFSRDEPFPILTWQCPVCGNSTRDYVHNKFLARNGMCSTCTSWWNDDKKILSDLEFFNKLEMFEKWLTKRQKRNS